MEIRTATQSDLGNLYAFNAKIYPGKKINSKNYIDFWLSRNEEAINHVWLVLDDAGNIVGQDFLNPMSFYYEGIKYDSYWGFDLIVEEKYRKDAWGAFLMFEVSRAYRKNFYSTGSGPAALDLNLKLGVCNLGQLRKYVGIVNPLCLITSVGRGIIDINKYPTLIKLKNKSFKMVSKEAIPSYSEPFNQQLLEISRDKDLMHWRFNNSLHRYMIYLNDSSDDYFVMRTTVIHGVTTAILVDYRCRVGDKEGFTDILEAAIMVTSKLHLSILITGSSHKDFDKVLESYWFKSVGRPRPIIGPNRYKDREQDIINRDFCFVTLADSDGETNWI